MTRSDWDRCLDSNLSRFNGRRSRVCDADAAECMQQWLLACELYAALQSHAWYPVLVSPSMLRARVLFMLNVRCNNYVKVSVHISPALSLLNIGHSTSANQRQECEQADQSRESLSWTHVAVFMQTVTDGYSFQIQDTGSGTLITMQTTVSYKNYNNHSWWTLNKYFFEMPEPLKL